MISKYNTEQNRETTKKKKTTKQNIHFKLTNLIIIFMKRMKTGRVCDYFIDYGQQWARSHTSKAQANRKDTQEIGA